MTKKLKVKSLNCIAIFHLKLKVFIIFICSLFTFHFSLFTLSHAKIYIDITSPAIRRLPISIVSAGDQNAKTIEETVKNDLYFTGFFSDVAPESLGAEITVNIEVTGTEILEAFVAVKDIIEDKNILRKRYEASRDIIRALSHSISNDIFKIITGRDGGFRTKIAYLTDSSGTKELHLMDWDGYNSRPVVSGGLISNHNWSYDGRYIAYSSQIERKWGLYLLDLERYASERVFLSNGLNLVGNISADYRMVFSSSKEGSPEIYIMDINEKSYKKLRKSYGIDISPVFSPDDLRIAFVSDRGGTPQVYIMDVYGRELRRITFEGNYNTSPVWSPDGKWIAFVGRRGSKNQIFMIKSDGTDLRQLTDTGNNEEPSFSPDGLFIAFDSDRDGRRGIYVMRIDGGGQKRITPMGITARAPKWAPYK